MAVRLTVLYSSLLQWSSKQGQQLIGKIFQTLDVDENGILDVDEYLAAVFHLSTYLFCCSPGCGKMLDVLRESGEVCLECPVPFMLCQEVRQMHGASEQQWQVHSVCTHATRNCIQMTVIIWCPGNGTR